MRKGVKVGSPLAGPGEQLGVESLLVVPRLPGNLLFGVGEVEVLGRRQPSRAFALVRVITVAITRTSYRGLSRGGEKSAMFSVGMVRAGGGGGGDQRGGWRQGGARVWVVVD